MISFGSSNNTQILNIDTTNHYVGIHQTKPRVALDISGVDGILLPRGTNVQRSCTVANKLKYRGAIRYNTDLQTFEVYSKEPSKTGGLGDFFWRSFSNIISHDGSANITPSSTELVFNSIDYSTTIYQNGKIGIGVESNDTQTASSTIHIYVGAGSMNYPYYYFYDDTYIRIPNLVLDTNNTYTFHRNGDAATHPFYISDQGYETVVDNIILEGSGSYNAGITGTETFTLDFNDLKTNSSLYYYCTTHPIMINTFQLENNLEILDLSTAIINADYLNLNGVDVTSATTASQSELTTTGTASADIESGASIMVNTTCDVSENITVNEYACMKGDVVLGTDNTIHTVDISGDIYLEDGYSLTTDCLVIPGDGINIPDTVSSPADSSLKLDGGNLQLYDEGSSAWSSITSNIPYMVFRHKWIGEGTISDLFPYTISLAALERLPATLDNASYKIISNNHDLFGYTQEGGEGITISSPGIYSATISVTLEENSPDPGLFRYLIFKDTSNNSGTLTPVSRLTGETNDAFITRVADYDYVEFLYRDVGLDSNVTWQWDASAITLPEIPTNDDSLMTHMTFQFTLTEASSLIIFGAEYFETERNFTLAITRLSNLSLTNMLTLTYSSTWETFWDLIVFQTGGTVGDPYTTSGVTYRSISFTSTSGTNELDLMADISADYLVVGGGGSGGKRNSDSRTTGGGGAGGFIEENTTLIANTYTITIGSGGAAQDSTGLQGNSGGNSSFSGSTAIGGGGGGGGSSWLAEGLTGGSGGGAAGTYNTSGGSGTSGQGNSGASSGGSDHGMSGGGGGAGASGQSCTDLTYSNSLTVRPNGGVGLSNTYLDGSTDWYAGGGGGGGKYNLNYGGVGGSYWMSGVGGGDGGYRTSGGLVESGTANTGCGGGGGSAWTDETSGSGGSGIVIARIPVLQFSNLDLTTAWLNTNNVTLSMDAVLNMNITLDTDIFLAGTDFASNVTGWSSRGEVYLSGSDYYIAIKITSSRSIVIGGSNSIDADVFIVGGGGGGGGSRSGWGQSGGGGGGAGGVGTWTNEPFTPNTYSITIGGGGGGGNGQANGGNGNPTYIQQSGSIYSSMQRGGGGGGAGNSSSNDNFGTGLGASGNYGGQGSGGGGGGGAWARYGGAGNGSGGSGRRAWQFVGGGGGGYTSGAYTSNTTRHGQTGTTNAYWDNSNDQFAGGGGGGAGYRIDGGSSYGTSQSGGIGQYGGGHGWYYGNSTNTQSNGTDNTGGGGGGGGRNSWDNFGNIGSNGSSGGSGIAIIRFKCSEFMS